MPLYHLQPHRNQLIQFGYMTASSQGGVTLKGVVDIYGLPALAKHVFIFTCELLQPGKRAPECSAAVLGQ